MGRKPKHRPSSEPGLGTAQHETALRRWLPVGALAALTLLGLAWWHQTRVAPIRREAGLDVLLITIDTLRADALGVYGQTRAVSPWLDRLGRAGVLFETAYAHNVVTLPSHANILSGRYPFEHGIRDNSGFRFPEQLETLATLLTARGYRAAAFVSGFPLDSRFGLDRSFEVYEDSFAAGTRAAFLLPERRAMETVALARAWREQVRDGPSFCWVHLYDPHAPYQAPEPFASRFAEAPYLGEVAATDEALRGLLEPLLERGRSGRTLVVLTADHGEALGDHGERTHGLFAYEATLRVPLVLYAPRLFAARRVAEPVRHVDLLPTILDALSLPSPAGLPGRSLLPLASGHREEPAESYFEALSGMLGRGWAPLYGVVHERRKFIDLPLPELYRLERDPGEARNLVHSQPEWRERLAALLAELRTGDRGIERVQESADTRERLAALGYVSAARAPVKSRYTELDDPKRLVHLDDMMQQVIARHRQGDLRGALELCREVVERRPDMSAALLQLALLHRRLGELEPAVAALERAFALNPEDLSAVVLLGSYLSEAGRAREAADLLEPFAIRSEPPLDVLTTRGAALARLGRRREALASFERARSIDPSNAMTLVQIATVHLSSGEQQPARAALEEALRLGPGLALAHHHLGLLALLRGDESEAEQRFRDALAREPDELDSLLNLGLLLARQRRAAEARPLLERFLQGAPAAIYGSQIGRVEAWLRGRGRAPSAGGAGTPPRQR